MANEYTWLKEKRFGTFYECFCVAAANRWQADYIEKCVKLHISMVVQCCYEAIKDIPLRTLIFEMHLSDSAGDVFGDTDQEKYVYYVENVLSNKEYIAALEQKYPELFRILRLRTMQTIDNLREIMTRLEVDKQWIVEQLCERADFITVENIDLSLSDSHKGGKTVAVLELNNHCKIVYKPHGLGKEVQYQKIFHVFCEKSGIDDRELRCLDMGHYGWQEYIARRKCSDKAAVQRYFYRMGIHLFLGYLLAATDLHGENIMAVGEYPIVLDVETFPGVRRLESIETCEEKANHIIEYSVLRTGLLPWNGFGKKNGAYVNAIHPRGSQESGFELPVVENDYSVNMKIGYKTVILDLKGSLPVLKGEDADAYSYKEYLVGGYHSAFMLWLQEQNALLQQIYPLLNQSFRVIQRNTQQYGMLLSLSFHPQYLQSKEKRKNFLMKLKGLRKGENVVSELIEAYEIECLLNLDIPIFYGEDRDFILGNGRVIKKYYPGVQVENTLEKMCQLTKVDCEIQKRIIGLAMEQLRQDKVFLSNTNGKEDLLVKVVRIADYLCDTAIIDEQEKITWIGVRGGDFPMGKLVSTGEDLYNGIPGVAIFFEKLLSTYFNARYKKILDLVRRRMFQYTEWRIRNDQNIIANDKYYNCTGAMLGVASNVYAYLILYKISGNAEYLRYAEMHSELIERNYSKDKAYDFLTGNAGAIYTLCRLYGYTKKEKYLKLAVKIGDWLQERVTKTEYGCGWIIPEQVVPLTGMSHGNSGFIMAYGELLRWTGDKMYKIIIEELWNYENHFYSEELGNWIDLRGCMDLCDVSIKGQNTWCHGAPGILLSRLRLKMSCAYRHNKDLDLDIKNALESMDKGNKPDQLCLCHGIGGSWLITHIYEETEKESGRTSELKKQLISKLAEMTEGQMWNGKAEMVHPGFMDGITGIGYVLLILSS